MRVENRIAAANRRDRRQHGVHPVKRFFRIRERNVVGKPVDLPAGIDFRGKPFRCAGGAADLPAPACQEVPQRAPHITKSEDENRASHDAVRSVLSAKLPAHQRRVEPASLPV